MIPSTRTANLIYVLHPKTVVRLPGDLHAYEIIISPDLRFDCFWRALSTPVDLVSGDLKRQQPIAVVHRNLKVPTFLSSPRIDFLESLTSRRPGAVPTKFAGPIAGSQSNRSMKLKTPNGAAHTQKGDPLVLPPRIGSARFQEFITQSFAIVGREDVLIIEAEDQLVDGCYREPNKTHDMHVLVERTYFVCSATISPHNVPEMQEIMRLCNEFDMPVWPISIGRNTRYRGAAPRVPGSICLVLEKHMNRVLEVNAEDAYALVEPGVTFFDLHGYMEKRNIQEKV